MQAELVGRTGRRAREASEKDRKVHGDLLCEGRHASYRAVDVRSQPPPFLPSGRRVGGASSGEAAKLMRRQNSAKTAAGATSWSCRPGETPKAAFNPASESTLRC